MNLPDIDGIKACEIIRREFDFPIIMLTAREGISDKVLGLECGAYDYMVKTFNFLELSARIKSVFKKVARSLVKEQHEFKDLTISLLDCSCVLIFILPTDICQNSAVIISQLNHAS